MTDYNVIVIGAGCGGLSVASQMAKQGRKTLLLEQSELIGGCCSTYESNGYKFDLGASIIEDPASIDRLFNRLGTSVFKEVDLISCDPTYTVITRNGTKMKFPSSIEETAKEIAKVSPEDLKGFHDFCEKFKGFLDGAKEFFYMPANNLSDMMEIVKKNPAMGKSLGLIFSSYQDVISKYFKNETVRESLSYQSLFIGLPPELCQGLYALIPYLEHGGMYYSKGGMGGIPQAIKRVGEKLGLEVRTKTPVAKVIIRNKKAVGVKLEDGTEISADIIISDIHAKSLYFNLIGEEHLPWIVKAGLRSYEPSINAPMLYMGVDYKPPLESHHTLFTIPVKDMNDYWWNVYEKDGYAKEPFGIISWTSGSDPELAPKGHHVLIITMPPARIRYAGSDWAKEKPALIESTIDYLSKKYIPGLKEHVKLAEFATPVDFEKRLRIPEGSIYAIRQDFTSTTIFRPSSKSKCIDNLYLVGASTHPGGGVPVTICSGMIVADMIEKQA
jgi:phytoene desaturase